MKKLRTLKVFRLHISGLNQAHQLLSKKYLSEAKYQAIIQANNNGTRCIPVKLQEKGLEEVEESGKDPCALKTRRIVFNKIKRSSKKEKFFK